MEVTVAGKGVIMFVCDTFITLRKSGADCYDKLITKVGRSVRSIAESPSFRDGIYRTLPRSDDARVDTKRR